MKCVDARYDFQFLRFPDHPNAQKLLDSILKPCKNLTDVQLVHLSMDSSSVNWKVVELLVKPLTTKNFPSTINIGRFSQYIIHGAFRTSVAKP